MTQPAETGDTAGIAKGTEAFDGGDESPLLLRAGLDERGEDGNSRAYLGNCDMVRKERKVLAIEYPIRKHWMLMTRNRKKCRNIHTYVSMLFMPQELDLGRYWRRCLSRG